MNNRVKISEPASLRRFMESFHENHREDFKALALHLVSASTIEIVSKQIGIPVSTLYSWQSDWNKKRNAARKNWACKTTEAKAVA